MVTRGALSLLQRWIGDIMIHQVVICICICICIYICQNQPKLLAMLSIDLLYGDPRRPLIVGWVTSSGQSLPETSKKPQFTPTLPLFMLYFHFLATLVALHFTPDSQ